MDPNFESPFITPSQAASRWNEWQASTEDAAARGARDVIEAGTRFACASIEANRAFTAAWRRAVRETLNAGA